MHVAIKRIYAPAAESDGQRILVERLWPRGLSKAAAGVDLWLKEVAPSTALRKWFAHDPEKWAEFQEKYRAELRTNPAFAELKAAVARRQSTLLFASRDAEHCNAAALQGLLAEPDF